MKRHWHCRCCLFGVYPALHCTAFYPSPPRLANCDIPPILSCNCYIHPYSLFPHPSPPEFTKVLPRVSLHLAHTTILQGNPRPWVAGFLIFAPEWKSSVLQERDRNEYSSWQQRQMWPQSTWYKRSQFRVWRFSLLNRVRDVKPCVATWRQSSSTSMWRELDQNIQRSVLLVQCIFCAFAWVIDGDYQRSRYVWIRGI